MSLLQSFDKIQLVKVGPSLRERLERVATANYRLLTIARLRRYRRTVEQEMEPEPWTALEAPVVLTLAEICGALGLSERERTRVLGTEGERMLRRRMRPSALCGHIVGAVEFHWLVPLLRQHDDWR